MQAQFFIRNRFAAYASPKGFSAEQALRQAFAGHCGLGQTAGNPQEASRRPCGSRQEICAHLQEPERQVVAAR